jgi:hypothetical protein
VLESGLELVFALM